MKQWLFFGLLFYSCTVQPAYEIVTEILVVTPVSNEFVYDKEGEALKMIGNQNYWIQYRCKYNEGRLVEFIKYYPEGPVSYSMAELSADTAVYSSVGIPWQQSWVIDKEELKVRTGTEELSLTRVDTNHYVETGGRRMLVIE